MRRSTLVIAFALLLPAAVPAQDEPVVVLTSLPATYAIGTALTENTSITIQSVPEPSRRLTTQDSYFRGRAAQLKETFEAATAVITIGKLWQRDPLYTAARSANIRIINIDATKPWSTTLEGISVIVEPEENVPWSDAATAGRNLSVWFWLSPSNAVRSADIIARDLKRIVPADAETIDANLTTFRADILALKREYEVKFSAFPDVTLFALASEFVYLTSDLGLYVDAYFLKQDIRWTEDDYRALEEYLAANKIRVVVHKWQPAAPIADAIARAGARLAVLETGDGALVEGGRMLHDGYQQQLRNNLELLHQALRYANQYK